MHLSSVVLELWILGDLEKILDHINVARGTMTQAHSLSKNTVFEGILSSLLSPIQVFLVTEYLVS